MKTCCSCKHPKELSCFSKCSAKKDGLASNCKECSKLYSKTWNMVNNMNQCQKKKLYREANADSVSLAKKEWYAANRESVKKRSEEYYRNNAERIKEAVFKYYKANLKTINKQRRKYYQKNKLKFKKLSREWRRNNLGKVNSYSKAYEASKIQATPKWLTEEHYSEIAEMYTLAQDLKWLNEGVVLHVDHIIPLRGEAVCGLHVPWNLQLLPPHKNHSKNNRLMFSKCIVFNRKDLD